MKLLGAILLLCASPLASAKSLTLEIRHLWNGKPVAIPGDALQTRARESIEFTRLSYLLSEPQLLATGDNATSGDWIRRTDWFAFVDAAADTTSLTLGGLPDAVFTKLRFHVGLDKATDRADPNQYPARHPLNPILNHLHWTPQGGYIFLALEGHLRDGDDPTDFAYHLGNNWNRMAITLPVALGLEKTTGRETDRRKFSTPSLRNIALTSPYMHDGRFETLEEVIDHYDSGLHRAPTLDPNLAKHPRDGLGLSKDDKKALVAFLKSLSDPQFK